MGLGEVDGVGGVRDGGEGGGVGREETSKR